MWIEARLADVKGIEDSWRSRERFGTNGHGNSNGHGHRIFNFSISLRVGRSPSPTPSSPCSTEGREPKLRYEYWAPKTQPLGTGGDMHFAFSYAVHAALVSVDIETGEIAVEKVVTAHDVGRAINPLSLSGQIEGGIVMGIGNALTEHYIEEDGVPWTQHLGQYKMPGIKMTPEMRNYIVEHAHRRRSVWGQGRGRDQLDSHQSGHRQRHLQCGGCALHGTATRPGCASAGHAQRRCVVERRWGD